MPMSIGWSPRWLKSAPTCRTALRNEPSRRVDRQRPAAGRAPRLGDALGAVDAGAAEARVALSRTSGRLARARPQPTDSADYTGRDRPRGSRAFRVAARGADGARLVARRRRRAAMGAGPARRSGEA